MDIGLEQYLNHPVNEYDESIYIHCLFEVLSEIQSIPVQNFHKNINSYKDFGTVYRTVAAELPRIEKKFSINSSTNYIPMYDMDLIASLLGRTLSLRLYLKINSISLNTEKMSKVDIIGVTDNYMAEYNNAISNAIYCYIKRVKDEQAEKFYDDLRDLSKELESTCANLDKYELAYNKEVINPFYDSQSTQTWKMNKIEQRVYKPYVMLGDLEFIGISIRAKRKLGYIDRFCKTFEDNRIFYFQYNSTWYTSETRVLLMRTLESDETFKKTAQLEESTFNRIGLMDTCLWLSKDMRCANL